MSLADSDRELVVEELEREPTRPRRRCSRTSGANTARTARDRCCRRSRARASRSSSGRATTRRSSRCRETTTERRTSRWGSRATTTLVRRSVRRAATGVGGIVRDTPRWARTRSRSPTRCTSARSTANTPGISSRASSRDQPLRQLYRRADGRGSVDFHSDYEGNLLVNVACIGLTDEERLVTAEAQEPGNKLVLVGNATGRDGLGGASFASEDLAEDAETEDRPAVQVGDPYAEKLLIEANEVLIEEGLIESARDLGAAGLGASSELVAKGGLGAHIELERVHQREPNMSALEILLAESQERMCYEVEPEHVDRVEEIAERFDLGCSVIGEVTDGNYVCTFDGSEAQSASDDPDGEQSEPRKRETVVDVDAHSARAHR